MPQPAGRIPKSAELHPRKSMSRFNKHSFSIVLFCCSLFWVPNRVWSQSGDTKLPDAPQSSRPPRDSSDSPAAREVTWRSLPKDFLRDQKDIWLFPVQLGKGKHWLPTLGITGATAGLIIADPHVMPYFQDHVRNLDKLNDVFDTTTTTAEVIAVPATLMLTGYMRHDQYQVSTALLAGE